MFRRLESCGEIMSHYEIQEKVLIVNGNKVIFPYKIDNVKVCNGLFIVLLDIPIGVTYLNNVFAVDQCGCITWQIQDPQELSIKGNIEYVGIRITENNQIIATNYSGITYTIHPTNGKIVDRGITK